LVEAARGDLDAALRSLEDALGRYGSLDMPIERARTLVAVGRVQRRRKQKRLARIALDEALLVFESVGATLWSTQVRDELARVNTRRAPATLTATEERVARLAAEGFTNRQIAERVFVSPKTVEANLARAYRKLGISSRAQLARSFDPDSES
jgi:DNA-binding NarL/FixJ family response regulator